MKRCRLRAKLRARKFKFEVDRRRYIASHSMIRRALKPFMDQAPDALRFRAGAHGAKHCWRA